MVQDQGFFSKNILLEGKSAVVTGSSRGIGRAIAIELARQGCDVLVNYSRNQSAATEVKEAIIQQGRKSIIFQANVGNLSHHQPLIEAAIDAFGKVDLLINNAGITIISDVLAESEKDYDAVMDVNLKGPHFLTQRVANYMIEKEIKGCIIYTLSISDTLASDNRAAYCMSKAALEMGMKTLTVEIKGPGSGRETALRALQARGFKIVSIKDTTSQLAMKKYSTFGRSIHVNTTEMATALYPIQSHDFLSGRKIKSEQNLDFFIENLL